MKINKIEKIVLLLICVALSVGFVTIYQRVKIENAYNVTEIVLDYAEMKNLADNSDESLSWWLAKFKSYGAESVAIQEETVNLLIKSGKNLRAEIVGQLIKNYDWENNYNKEIVDKIKNNEIDQTDAILTTKDKELYQYISKGIAERYSNDFYDTYVLQGEYYIVMKGRQDDLYYSSTLKVLDALGDGVYEEQKVVDSRMFNIGVGYDEDKINLVKDAGLDVVLRPINYIPDNEKLTDVYRAANEKYGLEPRLYIVHGKDILGYNGNEDKLLEYVKETGLIPVMIESATQREHLEQGGLDKLVEDSGYNSLRAFTMWDYIRSRYKYYNYSGAEEIENTMFRAITERNIRVIYFKPFFEEKSKYLTDEAEYEKTFNSLKWRLADHNIVLGKAKSIEEFHIGSKRLAIIAFGITLAAVYLFTKMFKIRHRYKYFLYLAAIPGGLLPLVMRNLAEKGFAFVAAFVFAGISIYFFMIQIKRILESSKNLTKLQMMLQSSLILIISVAISLCGAVFVDSMLCDVKYFLEMDIFRGVKAAQLLPLAVCGVVYIIYFANKKEEDSVKGIINTTSTILNKDIKIYYAIIVAIIGIVGYIYISRTGHETDLQPSSIEMIFRNFMENQLLARPRTKEFLIAFPAVFAAVFAANKKSELFTGIFILAGAIGASSVVNTFCHLRTPIYLSLVRTLTSLGFGIIIGCITILILSVINDFYTKIQERLK